MEYQDYQNIEINEEELKYLKEDIQMQLLEIEEKIPGEIEEKETKILKSINATAIYSIIAGIVALLGAVGLIHLGAPILLLIPTIILLLGINSKINSIRKLREKVKSKILHLKNKIKNFFSSTFRRRKRKTNRQNKPYTKTYTYSKKIGKKNSGLIFGTLARMANAYNVPVGLLRFAFVIGAFMTGFFPMFLAYFILSFINFEKQDESKYKNQKYTRWEDWDY